MSAVVVRDLRSGDEVEYESGIAWAEFDSLRWSPDSRYIAATTWGADVSHTAILDRSDGSWGDERESKSVFDEINPELGTGASVRGWAADGRLAVVAYPYPQHADGSDRVVIAVGARTDIGNGSWWFLIDEVKASARDPLWIAKVGDSQLSFDAVVIVNDRKVKLPIYAPAWPAATLGITFG